MPFLAAPIRHLGESVGAFYVGEKEGGGEFTPEDEETLVMFASQAALVIANARRYREEQRARTGHGDPGEHHTRRRGWSSTRRPGRRDVGQPGGE